MMKIVITGASGYVGIRLVPLLAQHNCELLLVGRHPEALKIAFPDHKVCSYDELETAAFGYDLLVHLAVLNTDSKASLGDFEHINVGFAVQMARAAKAARISRFVFTSSTHALEKAVISNYARTKRRAVAALSAVDGLAVETLYLPLVYSGHFGRRLSALNYLPKWLSKAVFMVVAALKPTVHISKIADHILHGQKSQTAILADTQVNNPVYQCVSRMIDLSFALIIIMGLGWLLLVLWALIKWETPGPGLFSQERVGRNGNVFSLYKLRTMKSGTANAATHTVSPSAITKLGKILRRSKLDELPQVFNILRNQINLVGPRPCLPTQAELLDLRLKQGVLSVKPGITGYSQVQGIDMSQPIVLAETDAQYIKLQCITLDLKIILATALGKGGVVSN